MSKKRMLADVLWEAANYVLWDGEGKCPSDFNRFTCLIPIKMANGDEWGERTVTFLRRLGAPEDGGAYSRFNVKQRQGVRYMWLLLAMHIAEDEGIEV